jgi:hypothetical protein
MGGGIIWAPHTLYINEKSCIIKKSWADFMEVYVGTLIEVPTRLSLRAD